MKFSVIIVFLGILFIGSGRSAVLPVYKYRTQTSKTSLNKEAGDIIEATVSSQSISLESTLDVLPNYIPHNDSESADWHKFLGFDSVASRSKSKESSISKKNLHSSKYRIRHHPKFLVPVDIEPSRPTNAKSLATTAAATSVTVAEIATTPLFSKGYQPVIKLEAKMGKENFKQIISHASLQEKIAVDSKATVYGKHIIPISELSSEASRKMIQRRLVSIFTVSSPAKPAILSCHKPEYIVLIKCLSSFARLTFLSEKFPVIPKVSLKGKNESVQLGHNSVVYIHWRTSNGTLNSRISNILTIDQLRSTCLNCKNLHAHLLLFEEGGQGCVLPVNCNSAGSGKVKIDESYKPSANLIEFDLPVISTSLSFQSAGVEELPDGDRVKSGQRVAVTITGVSETFPVGLFVRECSITIAEGPSFPLLSNGCSISNLLDNFNLTSGIVNNVEVFRLSSHFTVYNSEEISQPLTFSCRIQVCERKCGSLSSCQLHLTNYSSKNSKPRTILEESLSRTLFIDPEESAGSEATLLRELHIKESNYPDNVGSKPTPENFVSASMFYSTIFILSCIYTILLVFCVLCIKYYLIKPKFYMNKLDEATITTPERCFLNMEQVSARRRSPTQTMVFD